MPSLLRVVMFFAERYVAIMFNRVTSFANWLIKCCTQYLQSFDAIEQSSDALRCPACFAILSVDLSQPALEFDDQGGTHTAFSRTSIVNRINMENWRSSTKIEALVEELTKLRTEDRTLKRYVLTSRACSLHGLTGYFAALFFHRFVLRSRFPDFFERMQWLTGL